MFKPLKLASTLILLLILLTSTTLLPIANTNNMNKNGGFKHPEMPIEYDYMVTILSDDFENYTINTFPSKSNWTLIEEGKGAKYQCIVMEPKTNNKVLRLWGLPEKPATISYKLPSINKLFLLAISMDIYIQEEKAVIGISIGNVTKVEFTDKGTYVNGLKASKWSLRKGWNWISIVYNAIQGKLTMWINTITAKAKVTKKGTIGDIQIESKSLALIDNVRIAYVPVKNIEKIWSSRRTGTSICMFAWHPSKNILYIGTAVGAVFEYFDGRHLRTYNFKHPILDVTWSPNHKYILTDHEGISVTLYKEPIMGFVETVWSKYIDLKAPGVSTIFTSWAPDSKRFMVSATGAIETIWGYYSYISKLYLYSINGTLLWSTDILYDTLISDVEWSPKEDKVAFHELRLTSGDHEVKYVNRLVVITPKGKVLWTKNYQGKLIVEIEWSPDGEELAVATEDNIVYVYSPNGTLLWKTKKLEEVIDLDWSPNGKLLTISTSKGIYMFSANGKQLWFHEIKGAGVIKWSPDGSRIAVATGEIAHVYALNYTAWIDIPETIIVGKPANFTIHHTKIPATELNYICDFGDGGYSHLNKNPKHTYKKHGWYPIEVTIEHIETHYTITKFKWWIYVHSPPIPVITIKPAKEATTGTKIVLNATKSYDPDGNITSYEWLINGTPIGRKPIIEWTPNKPGTYNITLKVIDNLGLTAISYEEIKVKTPTTTTPTTTAPTSTTPTTTTPTTTSTPTTTPAHEGPSPINIAISLIIILLIIYIIVRRRRRY